jgi:hypothetical protein
VPVAAVATAEQRKRRSGRFRIAPHARRVLRLRHQPWRHHQRRQRQSSLRAGEPDSGIKGETEGETGPVPPGKEPIISKFVFKNVEDGLSNVPFVGEKHVPPLFQGFGSANDASIYNADNRKGVGRYGGPGVPIVPDEVGNTPTTVDDYNECFGSAHSNGAYFVYGDGSIRMLSYEIDLRVLAYTLHRSDGNTPPVD